MVDLVKNPNDILLTTMPGHLMEAKSNHWDVGTPRQKPCGQPRIARRPTADSGSGGCKSSRCPRKTHGLDYVSGLDHMPSHPPSRASQIDANWGTRW